ncbi:MAG: hypothetical protein KIT58_12555 [Planctomycetota bacterium]|nr:hypothetical protein [Planctomycetota bacterium]
MAVEENGPGYQRIVPVCAGPRTPDEEAILAAYRAAKCFTIEGARENFLRVAVEEARVRYREAGDAFVAAVDARLRAEDLALLAREHYGAMRVALGAALHDAAAAGLDVAMYLGELPPATGGTRG